MPLQHNTLLLPDEKEKNTVVLLKILQATFEQLKVRKMRIDLIMCSSTSIFNDLICKILWIACESMVKAAGEFCDLQVNSKIVSLDVNSPTVDGTNIIKAVKEDGTTIVANNAVLACGPW